MVGRNGVETQLTAQVTRQTDHYFKFIKFSIDFSLWIMEVLTKYEVVETTLTTARTRDCVLLLIASTDHNFEGRLVAAHNVILKTCPFDIELVKEAKSICCVQVDRCRKGETLRVALVERIA